MKQIALPHEAEIYKEVSSQLKKLAPKLDSISINARPVIGLLESKLMDFKPKLMFYGCYNAGKSTLVNALIGHEIAKVADKPETSKVTPYNYHGYEILDTPGLNAPIQHERVTKDCYKGCELVLFIMDDSNVEDSKAYEELRKILGDGKPLILVLNNKQDYSEGELEELRNKIYINLEIKYGFKKDDIRDRMTVLIVNANSALRAKLESKKLLLEKSGLVSLESSIRSMLSRSGTADILRTCNLTIKEFIDKAIKTIDETIDSKVLKIAEGTLTHLINTKAASRQGVYMLINKELADLKQRALASSNPSHLFTSFAQTIGSKIQEKLEEASVRVKERVELVQKAFDRSSVEWTSEAIDGFKGFMTKLRNFVDSLPSTLVAVKAIVNTALDFIEGVVNFISSLFGGGRSEEDAAIKQRISVVHRIDEAIERLRANCESKADEAVDSMFKDLLVSQEREVITAKETEQGLVRLKRELEDLRGKLPTLPTSS